MAEYYPANLLGRVGEQLQPQPQPFGQGAAPFAGSPPAAVPDMMSGINAALAANALKPHPQAQESHGLLRPGGVFSNVLGAIGDAFLVQAGHAPIYAPKLKQHRIGEALNNYLGNVGALAELYQMDPELASKAQELHRENDFRSAASDMLTAPSGAMPGGQGLNTNEHVGASPAVPGAYERAARADPEKLLTFQGKQTSLTADRLKVANALHDSVMQLMGGAHDQASYDAAKARASAMFGQYGYDAGSMNFPEQYSPEAIRDLQMQGMDTSKQLQAIARENRLNWDQYDDQADNERADTLADSTISDRNARRGLTRERIDLARARGKGSKGGVSKSGVPKTENALFADIQRRFNAGEPVTDRERQFAHDYQHRHGGREPQPRGAGRGSSTSEGAIIVKPGTNERMILRGGKWVPIK